MKKEVVITHLWVTEFGWENTILIQSDFQHLEVLGENEKDGLILMGIQTDKSKRQILKAYYK